MICVYLGKGMQNGTLVMTAACIHDNAKSHQESRRVPNANVQTHLAIILWQDKLGSVCRGYHVWCVSWFLSTDFKYVNSFKKITENLGILITTFPILRDLQCKTFLHFINILTFDHNRYLSNRDYVWIISCFFSLKPYLIQNTVCPNYED